MPDAVVLLSGGLDSYTAAAMIAAEGFALNALTIRYGQVHAREVEAARAVARALGVRRHTELDLDLRGIAASALTGASAVPKDRPIDESIPSTYVPARNTIFLSLALAWAETLGASDLVIGVNALDYSGYPDCRPEYIAAFEKMAALATQGRRRRRTPAHPHAARDAVEGRHHPARPRARPRLRPDPLLLRSAARRRPLRPLRQLRAARQGLRRGRRRRSRVALTECQHLA